MMRETTRQMYCCFVHCWMMLKMEAGRIEGRDSGHQGGGVIDDTTATMEQPAPQ